MYDAELYSDCEVKELQDSETINADWETSNVDPLAVMNKSFDAVNANEALDINLWDTNEDDSEEETICSSNTPKSVCWLYTDDDCELYDDDKYDDCDIASTYDDDTDKNEVDIDESAKLLVMDELIIVLYDADISKYDDDKFVSYKLWDAQLADVARDWDANNTIEPLASTKALTVFVFDSLTSVTRDDESDVKLELDIAKDAEYVVYNDDE